MLNQKMLMTPSQVEEAAKKKENENMRFRTFLKGHAEQEVLDQQFRELHSRIFPLYDCSQCRNCCKLLGVQIPAEEISRDASYLNMSREEFIDEYLEQDELGEWLEKHSPCGFLSESGQCILGEFRPRDCKDFPYTNQPNRRSSLYSVLTAASICPAAYEILEALKELYHFNSCKP